MTRGWVLTFQGKMMLPFFHTRCGGFTIAASEIWKISSPHGVRCDPCLANKEDHWSFRISMAELHSRLARHGIKPVGPASPDSRQTSRGGPLRIKIYRDPESGRVSRIRINDVTLKAHELRDILGPNSIKSTFFRVRYVSGNFIFEGKGWGHGAGMCQYGARVYAEKGGPAQKILAHYYPGAFLRRLY